MINNYYLIENNEQVGPFSHIELMERQLTPDTRILSPVTKEWNSAIYLPEFHAYFESEGIYFPTSANLANFWWRLLAYLIDYIIYLFLMAALGTAIGVIKSFTGTTVHIYTRGETNQVFYLAICTFYMLYNASFESVKTQGSIGKIICKLKVVDADGQRIRFPRALGRNAGKIISSLIFGAGFLNIFWDKRRQGWHDQMAKTYIIRKRADTFV